MRRRRRGRSVGRSRAAAATIGQTTSAHEIRGRSPGRERRLGHAQKRGLNSCCGRAGAQYDRSTRRAVAFRVGVWQTTRQTTTRNAVRYIMQRWQSLVSCSGRCVRLEIDHFEVDLRARASDQFDAVAATATATTSIARRHARAPSVNRRRGRAAAATVAATVASCGAGEVGRRHCGRRGCDERQMIF